MNILAENISRRRKELKMTQKQLAEKLNISDKTVSRWETGAQIPDGLIIPDIAVALQTDIGQLYGEKPVSRTPSTINTGVVANYRAALTAVIILLILSAVIVHKGYSLISSYALYTVLAVAMIILFRAEIKYRAFYNDSVNKNRYKAINQLYLSFTGFAALTTFNLLYKTLTPFSYSYITENVYVHIPYYHILTFILNCILFIHFFKNNPDKKVLLCIITGISLYLIGFSLYIFYPDPELGQIWTMTEINARKYSQYIFFAGSVFFTIVHWFNLSRFKITIQGDTDEKI